MNNFDLKKYLTENKLTYNSRILNESSEEKVSVVRTDWSGGESNPVVTLSNGKEYELELLSKEFEDGDYVYDYEAIEAPEYQFRTFGSGHEEELEMMDDWDVFKSGSSTYTISEED